MCCDFTNLQTKATEEARTAILHTVSLIEVDILFLPKTVSKPEYHSMPLANSRQEFTYNY
jgi:hypothetical protein